VATRAEKRSLDKFHEAAYALADLRSKECSEAEMTRALFEFDEACAEHREIVAKEFAEEDEKKYVTVQIPEGGSRRVLRSSPGKTEDA
jgi:hypothetical protein